MAPDELRWLYETAKTMQSITEVGAWCGRSTYALASGCKAVIFVVDDWRDIAGQDGLAAYAEFKLNTAAFFNIAIINSASLDAAPKLPPSDMVFIDAGHEYEEILADLRAWAPKATRLLCGHDYDLPGVKRAVDEVYPAAEHPAGSIWAVTR